VAIQRAWSWRALKDYLQWRGPIVIALLVLRELLRPICYWHAWHIFESNLAQKMPPPYAKSECTVKIHDAQEDRHSLVSLIAGMGELQSEEIRSRLDRGHLPGIAYSGDQPVGYMWLAFGGAVDLWFGYDTYWKVTGDEAVRYGSFVIPAFRGQAIHSLLNASMNAYARQHGIVRTLGAISILNPQSLAMPKRYRKAITMTVFLARVRGINWTIRQSFGAPLESRLFWRDAKAATETQVLEDVGRR